MSSVVSVKLVCDCCGAPRVELGEKYNYPFLAFEVNGKRFDMCCDCQGEKMVKAVANVWLRHARQRGLL